MFLGEAERLQGLLADLHGVLTPREVLARSAVALQSLSSGDRIILSARLSPGRPVTRVVHGGAIGEYRSPLELTHDTVTIGGKSVSLPLAIADRDVARAPAEVLGTLERSGIDSLLAVALTHNRTILGWCEIHHMRGYRRWRHEEIHFIEHAARLIAATVVNARNYAALSSRESRYRHIVDGAPTFALELHPSGRVITASRQIEEFVGEPVQRIVGEHLTTLIHRWCTEKHASRANALLAALLENETTARHSLDVELIHQGLRTPRRVLLQFQSTIHPSGAGSNCIVIGADCGGLSPSSESLLTTSSGESPHIAKVLEFGRTIVFRTDPQFRVTHVVGDTEGVLGLSMHEVLQNTPEQWASLLEPNELQRVRSRFRALAQSPSEFSEEFQIRIPSTQEVRAVVIRGAPHHSYNPDGTREVVGWEGFGLDHTERRKALDTISFQSRRIEALFQVLSVTHSISDPQAVMRRGLKALVDATNSDCGFGLSIDDAGGDNGIAIVAQHGLSDSYLAALQERVQGPSLVRLTIESREGVRVADVQADPRASQELAAIEGIHASMLMPILVEDRVRGVISLACRKSGAFSPDDFELLRAASHQIGLAYQQAELYSTLKRQAASLAALYRMSHELSQYATPNEIAEKAFAILHEELLCKRIWLGIINEQRTHLAGVAGFGPGVRAPLIGVQIELSMRHEYLDEVLATREIRVVPENATPECSGLTRVMKRLGLSKYAIVPLVWLGHVVGVLIVEPTAPQGFFTEANLSLLRGMANEMAAVLLARRFENRIAEAEKMRMAGLFAAGVAHNFNNLLQAIVGQTSLLQLQLPSDSPLLKNTATITEAVERGAGLVRQLLAFSRAEGGERVPIAMNERLREWRDLFSSLLGSGVRFELDLAPGAPRILGDISRLQHAMSNLIVNARDAILAKGERKAVVSLSTSEVHLRSNEVDPLLPPGRYLRITVTDNGQGMEGDDLKRCFEPFFTTKNADRTSGVGIAGSGLGLSTAYSIVRQHGGVITAQSAPREGTAISLYLPVLSETPVESESPLLTVPTPCTLYLVGLETPERVTIKSMCDAAGVSVVTCAEPHELAELVRSSQHAARVILVDGNPTKNGTIVGISQALRVAPETRVGILSSGSADSLLRRSFPEAELIKRPFRSSHLEMLRVRAVAVPVGALQKPPRLIDSSPESRGPA